jgi:processive 1,2-diacylglycerol beta-glucosyltransferase
MLIIIDYNIKEYIIHTLDSVYILEINCGVFDPMSEVNKQKILILSGDYGDGHKQAARALSEASLLSHPDVEVEIVDFMAWTHPHLHMVGKYFYLQLVKNFPVFYGYLFQQTRNDTAMSYILKKIRSFSLNRMVKLLEEVQPDIIVSTFPSASAAISILKAKGLTTLPTVTIMTDHTDHSYWLHPFTDQYLVGSEHVSQLLQREHGISESEISVTGIPIRSDFCLEYDQASLKEKHGLSAELPVVMVMGGGLGMIGKEFIQLLQSNALPISIQFVIICGHNHKLKQKLTHELRHSKHSILLTGYIQHVHEIMAVSDLIITKPGGLTISEALALELPMLLYKPLPGQEQDNAAFLIKAGAALQAKDEIELLEQLKFIFLNQHTLPTLKRKAKPFQMKSATMDALTAILQTESCGIIPQSKWSIYRYQRYISLFFRRKLAGRSS